MEDSCAPAKRFRVAGGSPVARVSESRMHIIEVLIHRALRRLLANEALAQIAFAAAAAAGALALILLLGTRFLEWWAVALIAVLALALGAVRVSRRVPDAYLLAQKIDHCAGLHDLLSTAVYFHRNPPPRGALRDEQLQQAEAAARTVNLEATFPLKFPRAVYPLAALSLLASGLVVLRYALTRSLDLRAPITEVLFEDQLARRELKKSQPPASAKSFKALRAAEALMAKLNMPASPDRQDPDALDQAIDQALAPPSENSKKSEKSANAGKTGQQGDQNSAEQAQNGDPLNGNQNANSAAGQDAKSPQAQQGGAPSDKSKSGNGSESDNNSSILSKLKDAVSNMFSKARQDGGSRGQKNGSPQNSQMARANQKAGDKNSGGKGQQQGEAQTESQEGDPNGDPQQGQQAQGKNAAKTSAQNSAQAGSGIGSQDGAKDLRAAEQLKAMGRISEIIGKRAATISGETMIEVQSGNQQLRTAYSDRSAAHGDADSDVSRDEIPSALQTYVTNYFEQVRKASGASPARKTPDVSQSQ